MYHKFETTDIEKLRKVVADLLSNAIKLGKTTDQSIGKSFEFRGATATIKGGPQMLADAEMFLLECELLEKQSTLIDELKELVDGFEFAGLEWIHTRIGKILHALPAENLDECLEVIREMELGKNLTKIFKRLQEHAQDNEGIFNEFKCPKSFITVMTLKELLDIILNKGDFENAVETTQTTYDGMKLGSFVYEAQKYGTISSYNPIHAMIFNSLQVHATDPKDPISVFKEKPLTR